jgi:mRNA interferase MazF
MPYEKNFGNWGIQKAKINEKDSRLGFREGEVWWCNIGVNVGVEIDGKDKEFSRPALVLKKFNNESFWAIPLTTSAKRGRFYIPVKIDNCIDGVTNISQLRLLDAKRLTTRIGVITVEDSARIRKAVRNLLNF